MRSRLARGGAKQKGDDGDKKDDSADAAPAAPVAPVGDLTVRPAPLFTSGSKRAAEEAVLYTTAAHPRSFSPLRRRRTGLGGGTFDDGLYVAPLPAASARALQTLEARLAFAPGSKALADGAGVLLRQPDPVRPVRVLPSWLDAAGAEPSGGPFEVERRRPEKWGTSVAGTLASGGASPRVLQVSVGGIRLQDHRLFLREHELQSACRSLVARLEDAHERQLAQLHALKISELKEAVADLREQIGGGAGEGTTDAKLQSRLAALCTELLETRQLKDEQECAERLLARRLLKLWHALKAEREAQGFKSTRARMQFRLVGPSAIDEEAEALARELEEEVDERKLAHALAAQAAPGSDLDEDGIRAAIERRQQELRRPPGEGRLLPVYSELATPTPPEQLPQRERSRQREAAREVLYARLLVDGRAVCELGCGKLQPHDMSVRLEASIQLQLLTRPASLAVEVWQRRYGGLGDQLLGQVYLSMPETASPTMPHWQSYAFTASRPFQPLAGREGIHEALENALDGVQPLPRHVVSGEVEVSTAWTTRPADGRLSEAGAGAVGDLASGGALAVDPQQVLATVSPDELDPNAPTDAPLLSLMARIDRGSVSGIFRHLRNAAALQWSSSWAASDRFSLFQLRRKHPGKWAQLPPDEKAVPPRDSLIPPGMRQLLRPAAEFDDAGGRYDSDRVAQEKASRVKAWITQVRARHEAARASQRYVMDTQDYVREPLLEVEAAEINCSAFLKLLEPRRKLLPQRRLRKPVPGSDSTERKIEVVVQSGFDLPVRAPSNAQRGRPKTSLFVEVRFQGQRFTTDIKSGANPAWNTILELNLAAPGGDWSQQAIMNLSDEIAFNLYDKVHRTERDERDESQLTVREESRWLGGFALPFSTLYRNGKLEGSFPLDTMPPMLLGYEKDSESRSQAFVPASALRTFLTINPLLPPPKEEERERLTTHDAKMQEFAKEWVKTIARGERHVRVFAPGADGQKMLLCRFIRPQNPPSELIGNERQLLRYVSLVPFLDDAAMEGGALDVWNTSDSFLDLGAGDQEEHAILLCNYLLAMNKESYVVLGSGIPEGLTAYVLTIEGGSPRLWNACTGRTWEKDEFDRCSLTSVGAVFNQQNIWANVGPGEAPAEVQWNLSDEKLWKPFFGKGGFARPDVLPSAQLSTLEYHRTTEDFRSGIEREVYDALQREVEELRGFRPTDWNRSVNAKLKDLLKRFEQDVAGVKKLTAIEHDATLERVRASYHMVGLPINVTYTDRNAIIKRVRETNIFLADAKKIQFALSVYVHAYPNQVCSVWVYCASLEDLRAGSSSRSS